MNIYESERDLEIRISKMIEQNGICPGCNKPIYDITKTHLSHILKQGNFTESKYSIEIIHHPENFKLTHDNHRCNAKVQMNTNKTELVKAHIDKIRQAIKEGL